jgi:hypothetical protein
MEQQAAQRRLRRLFCDGFRAMDIASPIPSFHPSENAANALAALDNREVDICLVCADATTLGYLHRDHLAAAPSGPLPPPHPIEPESILRQEAGLREAILILSDHAHCFITVLGEISAVIGPTDARKPPLRMWLFGMVTILEMFLHRLVLEYFPDDSWQEHISTGRLQKAFDLQDERQRRGEAVKLLDCLQITDKTTVLLHCPQALEALHINSKRELRAAIKDLESLRNNLAHGQDIVTHNADHIVGLASRLDTILTRA